MNREGDILVHRKVARNELGYLMKLLTPYLGQITVGCESTPNWYFLYDFCVDHNINFVLGHALSMRAISQAKVKNDRVDSQRIADLMRTNLLPEAYTCPVEYRDARDLMRKRSRLVQKRTDLKNSLTMSSYMGGFESPSATEKIAKFKRRDAYLSRAKSPLIKEGFEAYLDIIDCLDEKVRGFEKILIKHTAENQPERLKALMSAPGFGQIAGLTIIYESGDIHRFSNVDHYCSYARVACNEGESNGRSYGPRGRKQGNKYLKWIFEQTAVHSATHSKSLRAYRDYLRSKKGTVGARNRIAHRLARFAYFALKDARHFDINEFLKGKEAFVKGE